jgi:UDP-N-acetylmuramoyl-L-alanyl-D-glutamate--2,6-diaminopimelate ligase
MPKVGISRLGVCLNAILPAAQFIGADDLFVRSCCGRADECRPGDLFVALIDAEDDGHLQVELAAAAGATMLLVERLVASDLPQCIVADTRKAYALVCQALAGSPCDYLTTVGVTGSHGKTSIATLLESILAASGKRVGAIQSLGASVAGRSMTREPLVWTAPQLSYLLARQVLEECSHAIIELPSHCLASHHAMGLQLDVAVLCNIRRKHLDLHGSLANYRQVKTRILQQLKTAGVAVLNADDPICHQLLPELTVPCLTYGIRQSANVQGEVLEQAWGEQVIMISTGDDSIVVRTSQTGEQFLEHCLAAATTALALGLTLPEIARGLEQCHVISGRMQTIQCGQSFGAMVDAADQADQLAVLFKTAKFSPNGRTICVCTHHPDQTRDHRYHLGRIAERGANLVVLTGRHTALGEVDYEPFHQILDGMKHPGRAQVIPDRIRAIEWALAQAQPGDTVLVTGSGHLPVTTAGDDRWEVTDVDICQAFLYEQAKDTSGDDDWSNSIYSIEDYR